MLTAFFAVVDTRLGEMVYANGGHESPIVIGADGVLEEIDIPGRALGVVEGYPYSEGSRRLNPGDKVVMVTDGITEARSGGLDFFGPEGTREYVLSNYNLDLESIADGLLEASKKHAGGPLRDDAAIVAFALMGDQSKCERCL
jgi:sigma-B regulation protein RsbU (phosphoserine phosphatase)